MTGLRIIIIHSLRRPRFSMTWVLAQVAGGRRAVGELRRRRTAVLPDAFDLGIEAVDALAEQVDDLLLQAQAIYVHAGRAHGRRHLPDR